MFRTKISKEEVNELPLAEFEADIVVVDTEEKVVEAMAYLNKCKEVGIDTETKPVFKRGQTHKVALLQVGDLKCCFLFRLNMIAFPEELARFLADKSICKIGLALKDDFVGLNRHFHFKPENVIELQSLVKQYGILELGLQKIYAVVFGLKISKSQRMSNWESEELNHQQQRYAAIDAWAPLQIYYQLKKEKKLTKKEIDRIVGEQNEADKAKHTETEYIPTPK